MSMELRMLASSLLAVASTN